MASDPSLPSLFLFSLLLFFGVFLFGCLSEDQSQIEIRRDLDAAVTPSASVAPVDDAQATSSPIASVVEPSDASVVETSELPPSNAAKTADEEFSPSSEATISEELGSSPVDPVEVRAANPLLEGSEPKGSQIEEPV